ncbi:MAG: phosphopentomutase [Clostridiales bacterium]|nr:phosphopentomutase [Clostridiales bacterium]
MAKRVFLVVLDSFGIGGAPDSASFGDEGSNTLAAVLSDSDVPFPNLAKMGLFDIDGHDDERIIKWKKAQKDLPCPQGTYGRIRELSKGKDSTIGHWEMAGVYSSSPLPTYPDGFPEEIITKLKEATGRGILCNKPYSGTEVIKDYGEEHMKTGDLIVYTSADSVLQIAAHEDIVPVETLYEYCEKARAIMTGEHGVGRIIARPFTGEPGSFVRTERRHDFSLSAPSDTMCDTLKANGLDVISVGKIKDLFAQRGFTEMIPTSGNTEGIEKFLELSDRGFNGLCYINLVDFDMKYGHRNDIPGYAKAMHEFDDALGKFLMYMRKDDLLIITADHGCDPSTESTDHSRECVPFLAYGKGHEAPLNLGTRAGFALVAQTVYDALLGYDIPHIFEPKTSSHRYDPDNIMSHVDMTNLKVTATEDDIRELVESAVKNDAASICVQPCFVRLASETARGRISVCTVIGFPNGYSTTAVKKFEAENACDNGASEIDMVININLVKSGKLDQVADEIGIIADAVHRKGAILKVIIETCYLTRAEKVALCHIVTVQGADFIKTSTGFGTAGADIEDVRLMRKTCGPMVEVKAAGGIRSKELAKEMIEAGAVRIGASGLK